MIQFVSKIRNTTLILLALVNKACAGLGIVYPSIWKDGGLKNKPSSLEWVAWSTKQLPDFKELGMLGQKKGIFAVLGSYCFCFLKTCFFFLMDFIINFQKGSQYFWSMAYIVFGLIVPIITVYLTAIEILFIDYRAFAMEPVAQAAYSLTLAMSFIACILNSSLGALLGWLMGRFNFLGKKIADCFIDLPFSVSTAVSGAALATTYGVNGIFGHFLNQFGITVLFTRLGIAIAMLFASFPYMARTIQATLYEMEPEIEEASLSLGASTAETYRKVIFPILIPSLIAGILFILSRSIGEFGTIVMISSNVAYADLVATVLLAQHLENFDYTAGTVVGTAILTISFTLFIAINILQNWSQKLLNKNFKFTFD